MLISPPLSGGNDDKLTALPENANGVSVLIGLPGGLPSASPGEGLTCDVQHRI